MRRRLFRLAVRCACLLSLVGCVATVWAWRRSHDVGREYRSMVVAGRRFTVRSEAGLISLLAPPRPIVSAADARAAADAEGLSNGDIYWRALVSLPDNAPPRVDSGLLEYEPPLHVYRFFAGGAAAAVPALVAALDDPSRFAAAHIVLMEVAGAQPPAAGQSGGAPPELVARRRGSVVVLTYGVLELGAKPPDRPDAVVFFRGKSAPVPDAAQLPAVRDYWHDRLGVAMASVPHGWVALAASLPPLGWCLLRVRRAAARRGRVRRGGCVGCGYALTGNVSGVCPECGAACGRAAPGRA